MKNTKSLILFVLLMLLSGILSACTIVPYAFEWELYSITKDVTYINGNTIKTTVTQGVNYFNLIGIHNETTYIKFFEDGTLVFKPIDASETNGTYKCKNNGIENTTIYINLENGDNIEALGFGGYYEDVLEFEYNNVKYEFSTDSYNYECADQEDFNAQLRELAEEIRYYEKNPQHRGYFKPCSIVINENGDATLISEDEEIDLYSPNLGVTAIRITENNEVVYLDAIEQGECYFYKGEAFNYYPDERPTFINLYYLDPLPKKEEEENPKAFTIFELYPELSAYYNESNKNNITIKMSNELVNQGVGFYNYYNRITNQSDIDDILSSLMWMSLWDYGPPSDSYLDNTYSVESITISDNTGMLPEITIYNYYDRIKVGEVWYYHSAHEFPKFIYLGAFMKFACYDYNAEIYKDNELLGSTDILEDIEYIVDPNQDYTYSSLHDKRKLITEFGEITVYDETHFRYKGQYYLVIGDITFSSIFEN